jgi:hypothetical protein
MTNRLLVSAVAGVAFALAAGVSPRPGRTDVPASFTYPALASAAGTCSLAPLVCANDTSPGCETICGGEEQAVCVEGSCSPAGNLQTPNRCTCK